MANNFTRSPLIFDTAGSTVFSKATRIKKVRWVGATTAGHGAVITDADNRVIWESVCGGANYVEDNVIDESAASIKVPTLDSGKLYIHLEK